MYIIYIYTYIIGYVIYLMSECGNEKAAKLEGALRQSPSDKARGMVTCLLVKDARIIKVAVFFQVQTAKLLKIGS